MDARRVDAVLFDLDGTLADSLELIAMSFVAAFASEGFTVTQEAVTGAVGAPFRVMVPRLIGQIDEAQMNRLGDAYGVAYRANQARLLRPFAGAEALLDSLYAAGIPMAVVTNRIQVSVEGALEALGWGTRFHTVVGSDAIANPKPAPDAASHALARLGVSAARAAYVGDNEADAMCAAAAGIPLVVLVSPEALHASLRAAGATHTVTSLGDVAGLLL